MRKNKEINFYKAYILWKESLKNDFVYHRYLKSLNNKRSGNNTIHGSVGNKIVDIEWIERIEEVLPYMDKAIRESRSFIEQKDEIVSIEKVKKVNTQSIRHLAQHTNYIARVEANGDVKPEKILNIYYENSFAIYENRFLYTLVGKLLDFVEKRFKALREGDEKIEVTYNIDKIVKRKGKVAQMNLEFAYETFVGTDYSVNQDVSGMSNYGRMVRIRSIIQDFYAAPLIRALANCERVIPPIRHTNLMTKNVNFRNCHELWDYISMYRGKGCSYEEKDFKGKMPAVVTDKLQDIFVFANFLTDITFDTGLRRNLRREYKKDVRRERRKKKKELMEFKKKVTSQVRRAEEKKLKRKVNSYEKKIAKLQMQKEILRDRNTKLREKYNKFYKKKKRVYVKEEDREFEIFKEKLLKNAKKHEKNTKKLVKTKEFSKNAFKLAKQSKLKKQKEIQVLNNTIEILNNSFDQDNKGLLIKKSRKLFKSNVGQKASIKKQGAKNIVQKRKVVKGVAFKKPTPLPDSPSKKKSIFKNMISIIKPEEVKEEIIQPNLPGVKKPIRAKRKTSVNSKAKNYKAKTLERKMLEANKEIILEASPIEIVIPEVAKAKIEENKKQSKKSKAAKKKSRKKTAGKTKSTTKKTNSGKAKTSKVKKNGNSKVLKNSQKMVKLNSGSKSTNANKKSSKTSKTTKKGNLKVDEAKVKTKTNKK